MTFDETLRDIVGAKASRNAKSVSSTFKSDLQGWTVGDIASATSTAPDANNPPAFNATGGDKGGYISTLDAENIVAFLAPSQYTGDIARYYGGTLSFDEKDADTADTVNYPAVVIYGDGMAIGYSTPGPAATWTAFSIPLTQAGWTIYPGNEGTGTTPVTKAQFKAILADVTNIAIEADWHTGPDDTGLDSVVMAAKPKAMAAASPPGATSRLDAAARFAGAASAFGEKSGHGMATPRAEPLLLAGRLAAPH